MARRALCVVITLLTLFLVGTVVVLSTVVAYFGVDSRDVITEPEMRLFERLAAQAELAADPANQFSPVHEVDLEDLRDTEGSTAAPVVDRHPIVQDAVAKPLAGAADVVSDAQGDGDAATPTERDGEDQANELRPRAETDSSKYAASGVLDDDKAPRQRIPKIIHQTWKTGTLPERWETVRDECMEMHPEYEYLLWTDESSREFIATHYSWYLPTFDSYKFNIQRADAIRYFVLHHYGGIYMDLDIGCKRKMDPLLYFHVVLPATIPVGVSNDLMFAEKKHPFLDLVIHNLVTFDHQYGMPYATVMFSTGPMFLSAQYGMWPKEVALTADREVRILPRRWYGKNAPEDEMADSFFTHFYGSSWHADDAGFVLFLGKFGTVLMYVGLAIVVFGTARLLWSKRPAMLKRTPRGFGPIALPAEGGLPFTRPATPSDSRPPSPIGTGREAAAALGRGVLYYLPVWFYPNGGANGTGSGWSPFLPDQGPYDNRYQPIPPFSRPPSPSADSILHAPGGHDGAFDGVHMHSMRPGHHGPSSSSGSTSRGPHHHDGPTSPTSALPPAYSSLNNVVSWGSSFFRKSAPSSPKSPPDGLPFVAPTPVRPNSPLTNLAAPRPRQRPKSPLPLYTPAGDARDEHSSVPFASTSLPQRRASHGADHQQQQHHHERAGSSSSYEGGHPGRSPARAARHESTRRHASTPAAPSAHSRVAEGSANPAGVSAAASSSYAVVDDMDESDEEELDDDQSDVEGQVDRLLNEMAPDMERRLSDNGTPLDEKES